MRPNKSSCVLQLYQKEGENMQEKLDNLKSRSLLEIANWWGLHEPGKRGIIITQDKKLYQYHWYYRTSPLLEEHKIPQEYISEGIPITEDQYQKVIEFIEKEICNKDFPFAKIFDAGWRVSGHYKEKMFNIANNKEIYDKAEELIKKIKESR